MGIIFGLISGLVGITWECLKILWTLTGIIWTVVTAPIKLLIVKIKTSMKRRM